MKTDRELLKEFVGDRSQGAFDALVKRHLDWVYSVALRQVGNDRHLAEDVCQEVFFSVSRKAELLVELDALNGWLFRATQFAASGLVRSERRRRKREWEAVKMDVAEKLEGSDLSWSGAGELLDEAIGELREQDRDALCLRFFEERSLAEVGERLGIQENAARMRVNRAMDKLQLILEKRGVSSTAVALGGVFAGHQLVSAPAGLAAALSGAALGGSAASIGILGTSKVLIGTLAIVSTFVGVLWMTSDEKDSVGNDGSVLVRSESQAERGGFANAGEPRKVATAESGSEPRGVDAPLQSTVAEKALLESVDFTYVVSEEGVVVVSLKSIPVLGTHATRVWDVEGGARFADGTPIVLSEAQAQELKRILIDRVSGINLAEMARREFKEDLKTVVEDDLSIVLGEERALRFHFTRMVVR